MGDSDFFFVPHLGQINLMSFFKQTLLLPVVIDNLIIFNFNSIFSLSLEQCLKERTKHLFLL